MLILMGIKKIEKFKEILNMELLSLKNVLYLLAYLNKKMMKENPFMVKIR